MDVVKDAYKIALRDLRKCYGEKGIFAGLHHFKDYWARDSMFASFGSVAAKDYDIVRKNLAVLLENIDENGQVPLRIGRRNIGIALSIFNLYPEKKRKPRYNNDKSNHKSVDQNPLFVIALHNYVKKAKDKIFLDHLDIIERTLAWTLRQDVDVDLLIEEKPYCNWADSIKKSGKVLYTNVCFCHSLYCLSELFKMRNDSKKSKIYGHLYSKVKRKINEKFWMGEHYVDWIDESKEYSYYSTDGNILAIMWDIADKNKARHIEECTHIFDINDVPSQCVHPNYPNNLVSPILRAAGLKDYHNGLSWLWLGCINAIAKQKIGMKSEAKEIMKNISEIIVKHGSVYEVYNKKGNPIKRFYSAEHPFAWSSGLFVYAYSKIY